jgi:hypothetical protein
MRDRVERADLRAFRYRRLSLKQSLETAMKMPPALLIFLASPVPRRSIR